MRESLRKIKEAIVILARFHSAEKGWLASEKLEDIAEQFRKELENEPSSNSDS